MKPRGAAQVRSDRPQNCRNLALLSEADDFQHAAILAEKAIGLAKELCGTGGAAVSYLSKRYRLKAAWLTRLWERRHVPVYRHAFNNLVVAVEHLESLVEEAKAAERAKIEAIKNMGTHLAADHGDRPAHQGHD